MTDLDPLARALVVRAISRSAPEHHRGAALAVLRADVFNGTDHADHPAAIGAAAIRSEIMALTTADMPPSTDLVAILLETLAQRILGVVLRIYPAAQRIGGVSHAIAWQSIGINANRGRDLMARSAGAVDWPVWKTLRDAALG